MGIAEPRSNRAIAAFWLVLVPSILLLTFALLAAWASRDEGTAGAIYSFWLATVLLTPALCLHVLGSPGAPAPYRLAFWSAALVAYLSYLFWLLGRVTGHDWSRLSSLPLVNEVGFSLLLGGWWALDVLLTLAVRPDLSWVRLERGALSLLAFGLFVDISVIHGQGLGVFLGLLLVGAVLLAWLLRLTLRSNEPGSAPSRVLVASFGLLNHILPWHWLPRYLGAINLAAFRDVLRQKNLSNTRAPAIPELPGGPAPAPSPDFLYRRSSDGSFNDLGDPLMGAARTRFGRNIPLERAFPDPEPALLEPSPRVISNRLLARAEKDGFVPAPSLNLLAAAWIQFMTHDWFHHGTTGENPFQVKLDLGRGDTWQGATEPMLIRRTPPDPTHPKDQGYPPTYLNDGSHWWDGSQVYGNNETETEALRAPERVVYQGRNGGPDLVRDTRGELKLSEDGLLPINPYTQEKQAGVTDNWWLGLSLVHTLFAREHNAIAARLRLEYPAWEADRLFHTARLVNVALMAKIHTTEWTPAILSHPTLDVGMNANWAGLLTERFTAVFGRVGDSEMLSGIPGSPVNHHGAPFCLTEEFGAVYRLHPLLPDSIKLCRARDGSFVKEVTIPDVLNEKVRGALEVDPAKGGPLSMDDVCYSFAIANPGKVVLHNYPNFLRNLRKREDGTEHALDLAAVDILRDRERGVPRYNDFRELFHLPRVPSFEELTSNALWAKELREVYGDVNRVDLMVGLFAEDFPEGFGFSETAFRVFILMASRRLKSDRFFTTDYNVKVYTKVGMEWINDNTMSSVILRHFPTVAPALRQVKNPFAPWPRLA